MKWRKPNGYQAVRCRIVPKKPVMTVEGRQAHNNAFPEETFTVLRDGGLNGNEIRKNSR